MTDVLNQVRDLKTKAKNRRDDEAYEEGVDFANQAIEMLDQAFATASSKAWRSQLASELADCHGLIGGLERRWGIASEDDEARAEHLRASVAAYETGNGFEREDKHGVVNSYNLVNRLVSHLMLDPEVDLEKEMKEAQSIVAGQLVQLRRGDIWALADEALLALLLGDVDATSAWQAFRSESPPDYAYGSVLDTLEPLAELELEVKGELEASVQLLTEDLENF